MLPAFEGEKVDQILLTGGMARCRPTVAFIQRTVAALQCQHGEQHQSLRRETAPA